MSGRLIGVGVGPGDPELVTLKALRALREADVVAYFAKAGNASHARTIVAAPSLTFTALMKDPSILILSNENARRLARDE